MPAHYQLAGVRFDYPENWTVDDGDRHADPASVTVSSPGGAFWTLTIHEADADPAVLIDTVLAALRDEYEQVDAERAGEIVDGRALSGYDVNFYCLDLISAAMIRGFQTPQGTYVVLCQAEDSEFELLRQVFLAVTTSLLRGLAAPSPS